MNTRVNPPARPPTRLWSFIQLCRLNKPIGSWLLLFPCLWGLTLASKGLPQLKLILLFTAGAILMRGAGCVYNDWVDCDLDKQVTRTKERPLASGAVSRTQAWLLISLLCLLALLILVQFSSFTIILGFASLVLVLTYPWMKRITYWPQAFLGLTFNWGALMGWSAIHNRLDPAAFWLFCAGIAWTLFYDTIYAHQDSQDDSLVGIKSSALRLGQRSQVFLYSCSVIMIACLTIAGYLAKVHILYYLILLPASFHLKWQCLSLDTADPQNCLYRFKSNIWVGLIVWIGLLVGVCMKNNL